MITTDRGTFDEVVDGVVIRHENDIVLSDFGNKVVVTDVTGKYTSVRKDISIVGGKNAVKCIVDSVVKTCKGELQLNVTRGLPYFQIGFGAREDAVYDFISFLREAIMATNGVAAIQSLDWNIQSDGRKRFLSYTATISADSRIEGSDEPIVLSSAGNPNRTHFVFANGNMTKRVGVLK